MALELAHEKAINDDVRDAAAAAEAAAAERAAAAEAVAADADRKRRGVEEELVLIREAVVNAEDAAARAAAECGALQRAVLTVKQVRHPGAVGCLRLAVNAS